MSPRSREVHFVVPEGIDDVTRPSGGNVYDRRVAWGLAGLGWRVTEVTSRAAVPDGALTLVDGMVAATDPDGWRSELGRLDVVPVVHLPFGTPGEDALLRECPAVVATSHWTERWLVSEYAVEPGRVHVARPGVEMADPAIGTDAGTELLCVGAVSHAKGHDLLVEALAELRHLDWRCTLVGSLDVEPRLVEGLRERCVDTGIADRVSFDGPRGHDEVAKAYGEADLLVVPSRFETYGMVVTEALAHAVPVVAAAGGGVEESLGRADDGSLPGLLVARDDADALAGAVRRWLEDPLRRRRLRRAAARRRLTLTGWSTTTARVAQALSGVRS